jgi:hypothetical protein
LENGRSKVTTVDNDTLVDEIAGSLHDHVHYGIMESQEPVDFLDAGEPLAQGRW